MNRAIWRGLAACAAAIGVAVQVPSASAQEAREPLHLLAVPFLPQHEALCGGAAAAMIMRFWGDRGAGAETFAPLVNARAGGIRGEDLADALRAGGWAVSTFKGDAAIVRSHLEKRRPLIALIEVRPGRFHYVVVIGWSSGRVVVHDPARAPFRMVPDEAFVRAWAAAGYWTLLALPPPSVNPDVTHERARGTELPDSSPCDTIVAEGVRLAVDGHLDEARDLLESTSRKCPDASGPWRELAGLHALKREWVEAAADAREALHRDGRDDHAARILATSLFLDGQPEAALNAWNRVGEPYIDLLNVGGLQRVRYAVVARALRLEEHAVLTRDALTLARRRIGDVPGVAISRVSFTPGRDGVAEVNAAIVERPLLPFGRAALAGAGLHALVNREVTAPVSNPTGGGEVFSWSWRWWEHRPAIAFAMSTPSPTTRLGTTWTIGLFNDRQTYMADSLVEERRRGAMFRVSDWSTAGLRWEAGVSFDHWNSSTTSIALTASINQHMNADRVMLSVGAALLAGDIRTASGALRARWRSSAREERSVWLARGGLDLAGKTAPLAMWPGAGTGQGRDVLLRAHPLLQDGIVQDGVFGRRLSHAGAEWQRWMRPPAKPLALAPALFVDLARATDGAHDSDRRVHVDAGAGLRIAVIGTGVLRIDLAHGLRDGATALSIGYSH